MTAEPRRARQWIPATLAAAALTALVAACGGGGGSDTTSGTSGTSAALSSGAITAFGSVFVNGHEFGTGRARVIDDDTGAILNASALEVGMVVDVKPMHGSTHRSPEADEVRVRPLARGYVEAIGTGTVPTVTVMGQTVQLTSGTVFSDHRACLSAATPCAEITAQSGLTSGLGTGSFVGVHGYLFAPGAGSAQIVATLIVVRDAEPTLWPFKVEGQVTAVDAAVPSVTIGAETVDLHSALCRAGGATVACAGAYKVGDIVAAWSTSAPTGSTFTAGAARRVYLVPQTPGATVEVEGRVSSVNGTSFVVRGIPIDGSALPAGDIPAVGDKVEVIGIVADDGLSVKATSMDEHETALASRVAFAGPLGTVAAGSAPNTWNVTVLGQTAIVDAQTRIADRTNRGATFNITNFADYLSGKTPYVVVRTVSDSTGTLHATGFDIVAAPRNPVVAVAGAVDADPVVGGNTATIAVHGVSIVYDPAAATVTQGRLVIAKGPLNAAGAIDTTASNGRFEVLPLGRSGDDCGIDVDGPDHR